MNHTEAIEMMLKNLDSWRHLPKYQLERRADLFFGLFINSIVASHLNIDLQEIVIPEFPYKNTEDRYTTVNFDYVLFSKDTKTVYLLELKTDAGSVDDDQLAYLTAAKAVEFNSILSGIVAVSNKSKHNAKYGCLLKLLADLKVVSKDQESQEHSQKYSVNNTIEHIQILYLSPQLSGKSHEKVLAVVGSEDNIISFTRAAELLEKTGAAVECHFASYLRRWDATAAGSLCNE